MLLRQINILKEALIRQITSLVLQYFRLFLVSCNASKNGRLTFNARTPNLWAEYYSVVGFLENIILSG